MKWVFGAIKLAGSIIGGWFMIHVIIAVVLALGSQSIPTGVGATLHLMQKEVIIAGALSSYGDNAGSDWQQGKAIGDKALPDKKAKI